MDRNFERFWRSRPDPYDNMFAFALSNLNLCKICAIRKRPTLKSLETFEAPLKSSEPYYYTAWLHTAHIPDTNKVIPMPQFAIANSWMSKPFCDILEIKQQKRVDNKPGGNAFAKNIHQRNNFQARFRAQLL